LNSYKVKLMHPIWYHTSQKLHSITFWSSSAVPPHKQYLIVEFSESYSSQFESYSFFYLLLLFLPLFFLFFNTYFFF
jgi:hypothetical protein